MSSKSNYSNHISTNHGMSSFLVFTWPAGLIVVSYIVNPDNPLKLIVDIINFAISLVK